MHNWTKSGSGVAILALAISAVLSAEPAQRDRAGAGDLPERAQEALDAGADAAAGAIERAQQGVERRMEAFERQMAQFEQVHARRSAQLERLRELAIENDREDVLERVNGLIEREVDRFSRQIDRLRERIEEIRLMQESESVDDE